jgi:uncharacterized protein (UPF0332 family)
MNQVDVLVQKADENIEVAEMLLHQGHFDISASRAYYAMFYLAEALLFSKGLSFSSHSAVIAAFGREFAKTNLIAPRHHRSLRDGFETRQIGDYSFETTVSREKAAQVLKGATEFFTAAKEYLAAQGTGP